MSSDHRSNVFLSSELSDHAIDQHLSADNRGVPDQTVRNMAIMLLERFDQLLVLLDRDLHATRLGQGRETQAFEFHHQLVDKFEQFFIS